LKETSKAPESTQKEVRMKKVFFVLIAVSLVTACSNPVLKWIDTPRGRDAGSGEGGRIVGQSSSKEIVSFTFGIEGEEDFVSNTPDPAQKYPISVILPMGSAVTGLSPAVTFVGKSLSPPSGEARNFGSPVDYTVSAEDGSSRTYRVTVFVKTGTSKEIVRFAAALPSGLTAEGIIDQEAGTIAVSVPAGMNTGSLTVHVAHTGLMVKDHMGNIHPTETFDYTGDFLAPREWKVFAPDFSEKTYTVTVVKEKSHDKEITAFSLGSTGEEVIIGGVPRPDGKYPILAMVPDTFPLINISPSISYTGESISPGLASGLNFETPKTYTVTAEDRSTKDYVVTVVLKDDADSIAQITGFYFTNPLVEGLIDETAKTIALMVPFGTNLSALVPEIYYIGASVSPISGQPNNFTGSQPPAGVEYTVRSRDGTKTQKYSVHVFTNPAPANPSVDVPGTSGETVNTGTGADGKYTIIVELPVFINSPTVNINYQGGGTTIIYPVENVNNTTVLIGGDTYYNVIVINQPSETTPIPDSAASIDAFYFTSPAAIGVIGATGDGSQSTPYSITVQVPYGTDLQNLTATVCYTGKEIAGIPGSNPLADGPRSFVNPVIYTVVAANDTVAIPNRKYYEVCVEAVPSNAKEITAFTFDGVPTSAVISAMPNAGGKYPILVTVPAGQSVTSLAPVVTYTGKSILGDGGLSDNNGPGTVTGPGHNFSVIPVNYTVTAENGSFRTYAVTVRNAESTDDPKITGFYFTEPLAAGVINEETNTITVAVPSGTNRGSLVPTVYFNGQSVSPGSGAAANFTGPKNYTVTGPSGKTRSYTVTVNLVPSSAKDITRFQFPGIANTETIIGATPNTDGSYPISVRVPTGTDLGSLAPDIEHTGVGISPAGGIPGNFAAPRTYTVTAENGSSKVYTVTVYAADPDAKLISSFIFETVPVTGGAVRVVASIDQSSHDITAEVPYTADISGLAPTITWIGKTIAGPTEGEKTANPFTDIARDFSSSQTYIVTDQNSATLSYTVTVTRQSAVTVTFEGEVDYTVIADHTFDQATGLVTVTVNDDPSTGVSPPYEWHVNGAKQPVSPTETSFSLSVGDGSFIPGRHEIMVSGRKNGLHYTGKVYFLVAGGGL
jgi:hypothetical protein